MKSKEQKQQEAIKRQQEYDKLTPNQKILKFDIQFGNLKGATKERFKLVNQIKHQITTGQVPVGVGDSVQKEKKKPYQKPKRS